MTASRHKKRRVKTNITRRGSWTKRLLFVLLVFFLIITVVMAIQFRSSVNLWSDDQKLAIAVDNGDQGVAVILLDPTHNEIYKFLYPEDLQIEAARNLGTWKIGSLWRLGADEEVGGMLLANSISKSIKTPVVAWAGTEFFALIDKSYINIPKSLILLTNSSNLSIIDMLKIARFASRVDDSKVIRYTPENMNYISKQKLNDGTDGFVVSRQPGARILTLFVNDYLRSQPNSTVIINASGNRPKARQFGEVLEITGIKIAAIREEAHEISDCEISSADERSAELLSRYFSCSYNTKTSTNFDIEIRIGNDLIDRF